LQTGFRGSIYVGSSSSNRVERSDVIDSEAQGAN
jgi:hypothetical protein